MDKHTYVGKPKDLRNDIMREVDKIQEPYSSTHPHFMEWTWGVCSSQGGHFESYEMCRLEFKNKRIPKDIKDWILHNIKLVEVKYWGLEVIYRTDYIEFRRIGDGKFIKKEVN